MAEKEILARISSDIPKIKTFLIANGFSEVNYKEYKYQDTLLANISNKTFFIVDGDGMYELLVKGELVKYEVFITKEYFIDYVCGELGIDPNAQQDIPLEAVEPKKKRTSKK